LWERWKRGESISEIGRALDRAPGAVHCTIREHGGVAPRERRRGRLALTLREREEISFGVAGGASARWIGARLGRSPSAVTREFARHGGRRGYRAADADRRTWQCARRPQRCKLSRHPSLARIVAARVRQEWSPEQIAGWLKRAFPHDKTMRVSHETICLTLFIQARGALKRELLAHLRRSRSIRRPRTAKRGNRGQAQIVDAVSIRQRPAEAADRAIPGHWEGDLLTGSANSHVATLVERHSRFLMFVAVDGKNTRSVTSAQPARMQAASAAARVADLEPRDGDGRARTLTIATDVKVYFCDPQSPGSAAPTKTPTASCASTSLAAIATRLNTRPRRTLDFKTPAANLDTALH
jgi:IS30 family transposase